MKRLFVLALVTFCLTSCGFTSSLYYWGGEQKGATTYENLAYMNYDKQTPESICKLICMYEDIVVNTGGSRKMPPPGICAEYGYMLLLPENADKEAIEAHVNNGILYIMIPKTTKEKVEDEKRIIEVK